MIQQHTSWTITKSF